MTRWLVFLWFLTNAVGASAADTIAILVAKNFESCLTALADSFTAQTSTHFSLRSGATGILATQLQAGAPGDIFFAADSQRPQMLDRAGLTQPGSRCTYAIGRLVLWCPGGVAGDLSTTLDNHSRDHLALANPRHAPYGGAAEQTLRALGRWSSSQNQLVRGTSVGQTWQFVHTGAAALGFVSLAQTRTGNLSQDTFLIVTAKLHQPLVQQAVLMRGAPAAAASFLAFVCSDAGAGIVRRYGYEIPAP